MLFKEEKAGLDVSLIWSSIIRLLCDPHVLFGNHLDAMYNTVSR